MRGDIKYLAHIAQEGPQNFFKELQGKLEEASWLDVEVQYASVIQHNGIVLFSAMILGRLRE